MRVVDNLDAKKLEVLDTLIELKYLVYTMLLGGGLIKLILCVLNVRLKYCVVPTSPVSFQVRGLDIGTDWLRWTWLFSAFSIVT